MQTPARVLSRMCGTASSRRQADVTGRDRLPARKCLRHMAMSAICLQRLQRSLRSRSGKSVTATPCQNARKVNLNTSLFPRRMFWLLHVVTMCMCSGLSQLSCLNSELTRAYSVGHLGKEKQLALRLAFASSSLSGSSASCQVSYWGHIGEMENTMDPTIQV